MSKDQSSHHAVHGKVVVLGLQLHGVGVVVADLSVSSQKQPFVVHDPVKHLQRHSNHTHTSGTHLTKSRFSVCVCL